MPATEFLFIVWVLVVTEALYLGEASVDLCFEVSFNCTEVVYSIAELVECEIQCLNDKQRWIKLPRAG